VDLEEKESTKEDNEDEKVGFEGRDAETSKQTAEVTANQSLEDGETLEATTDSSEDIEVILSPPENIQRSQRNSQDHARDSGHRNRIWNRANMFHGKEEMQRDRSRTRVRFSSQRRSPSPENR